MIKWGAEPANQQVAADLRRRIYEGEFDETGMLPSYAKLTESYGVSITVARDAVHRLQGQGLITVHQGKGAFLVMEASGPTTVNPLEQLREEVARLRREVRELRQKIDGN